jgi:hypothetical protein
VTVQTTGRPEAAPTGPDARRSPPGRLPSGPRGPARVRAGQIVAAQVALALPAAAAGRGAAALVLALLAAALLLAVAWLRVRGAGCTSGWSRCRTSDPPTHPSRRRPRTRCWAWSRRTPGGRRRAGRRPGRVPVTPTD